MLSFGLFLPQFRYSVSISRENWDVNHLTNVQVTKMADESFLT